VKATLLIAVTTDGVVITVIIEKTSASVVVTVTYLVPHDHREQLGNHHGGEDREDREDREDIEDILDGNRQGVLIIPDQVATNTLRIGMCVNSSMRWHRL